MCRDQTELELNLIVIASLQDVGKLFIRARLTVAQTLHSVTGLGPLLLQFLTTELSHKAVAVLNEYSFIVSEARRCT